MLSIEPRMPLPDSPEKMISSAPELEALPPVAQRPMAMICDDRVTMDAVATLLGTDQALTAAVLRYANSTRAISDSGGLRDAVVCIGKGALGDVLLRACTGPLLDRGLPPYALPRRVAWRHAATASAASAGLARLLRTTGAEGEGAGVAGLLHDVGKMVLTSVVPEAAAEAVSIARSRNIPVWQAEELVIGFHHGAVGGALLRWWGLPDSVVDAVAFHHEHHLTSNPLATVVFLADAAAHSVGAVGSGGACPQPAWEPGAAATLGASPEQVQNFLDNLLLVEEAAP